MQVAPELTLVTREAYGAVTLAILARPMGHALVFTLMHVTQSARETRAAETSAVLAVSILIAVGDAELVVTDSTRPPLLTLREALHYLAIRHVPLFTGYPSEPLLTVTHSVDAYATVVTGTRTVSDGTVGASEAKTTCTTAVFAPPIARTVIQTALDGTEHPLESFLAYHHSILFDLPVQHVSLFAHLPLPTFHA